MYATFSFARGFIFLKRTLIDIQQRKKKKNYTYNEIYHCNIFLCHTYIGWLFERMRNALFAIQFLYGIKTCRNGKTNLHFREKLFVGGLSFWFVDILKKNKFKNNNRYSQIQENLRYEYIDKKTFEKCSIGIPMCIVTIHRYIDHIKLCKRNFKNAIDR